MVGAQGGRPATEADMSFLWSDLSLSSGKNHSIEDLIPVRAASLIMNHQIL